jgi:hypothetical protein
LNGVLGAGRRNADTGKWESVYVSGRSDMALVQSLRDDRMRTIAVRTLILHDDLGLYKEVSEYPSLPRLASRNTNAHLAIAA